MKFILIQLIIWGAILGGYALARGLDPVKRARRALDDISDTPIQNLTDGAWARVTGTVAPIQALQPSPIGQRGCIGFRLVVERAIRGDPSNGFKQILNRESCSTFLISDETGTATVEGPFMNDLDFDDSSWTDLPPTLFKLLDEAGASADSTDLRFSEAFVLPGDKVTVLGTVSVEIHPAGEPQGARNPPIRRRIIGANGRLVVLRDAEPGPS